MKATTHAPSQQTRQLSKDETIAVSVMEITRLTAENEALRGRVAELEDAVEYGLPYLKACVPNPRNSIAHDYTLDINCVKRAERALKGCSNSWLLRKQAEAVERLASHYSIKSLMGSYIWKEAAIEEANRLRTQADKLERNDN